MPLPSAAALADEMALAVRGAPPSGSAAVGGLVAQLVRNNLRQWDLEDETRDPHASDSAVATAKRAIDQLNTRASAPLATESPGMVLDRLSVLVIRRARTATMCADRLPALDAQLAVLVEALDSYLEDLYAGRRRFVAYEHLKLYAAGPNATRTHPD